MAMSYNKLWKMLIDKGMKRAELRDAVDMSTNTLAKLDMKNLQTAKYNVDRLLKSEQSKEQDEKQKTTEQTL
jgi:DNA-binding Xre family transcriptional regulator